MSDFLYSPTARGFYLAAIHGDTVPEDARPVTQDRHAELMAGQADGFEIAPDAMGDPQLVTRPALTEAELLDYERQGMALTRTQFARQARISGVMTVAEALEWGRAGVPTPMVTAALALIPAGATREDAEIAIATAQVISRLDPIMPAVQAAAEWTDAQVDAFFRAGMLL
jgi:hypothetical protein